MTLSFAREASFKNQESKGYPRPISKNVYRHSATRAWRGLQNHCPFFSGYVLRSMAPELHAPYAPKACPFVCPGPRGSPTLRRIHTAADRSSPPLCLGSRCVGQQSWRLGRIYDLWICRVVLVITSPKKRLPLPELPSHWRSLDTKPKKPH